MEKLSVQELLALYNKELCAIIYNWENHNAESVLIAFAELKRRDYSCHQLTIEKLVPFSENHGYTDMDAYWNAFLSEHNCQSYNDFLDKTNATLKESGQYEPIYKGKADEEARKQKLTKDILKIIGLAILTTIISLLVERCASGSGDSVSAEIRHNETINASYAL